MEDLTHEQIIEQLAKSNGDMNMSLIDVLNGAMSEMGGPTSFGQLIGRLMSDPEVTINSRVSLINNYLKLMGQYSEKPPAEEWTPEQLSEAMKELGGG